VCVLSLSDIHSRSQILLVLSLVNVGRCNLAGKPSSHFKYKAKRLPIGQSLNKSVAFEENKNVANYSYFTRYTSFETRLPHELKKITFYPLQDIYYKARTSVKPARVTTYRFQM
jgi:hypothetical protein